MTPDELRRAMRALRFTQQAAADHLGVDVLEVRRWLAGEAQVPEAATARGEVVM